MVIKSTPKYSMEKYGAIFDAHVHSHYDYHDGRMSPETLVKMTLKWGFNWVNAMAHDTVKGMNRIRNAAKDANLPSIPAMEISTNFNHLLAFGVHEWPYAKDCWDPDIVIERLRAQDCAIFVSHPCVSPWRGEWTPEIVKRLDIDGIEWINGSSTILNKNTHRLFANVPKGRRIAGTDAHVPRDFGYAFTQVNINSTDPDDLVSAMKAGKCCPGGYYIPLPKIIINAASTLIKRAIFPPLEIDGKWIMPDHHLRGYEPHLDQEPKQWSRRILKQPPKITWI
jgi:predicted metal-dependent phosphoesterase TrpH